MMTYQATLDYLFEQLPMFQRVGKYAFKKTLDNIKALCAALGDPQDRFHSIHIAGTNGKGSTTHILAAIYQQAGYRVGVYTSPHYRDFRERIKINGQYISEAEVVAFVHVNRPLFEKLKPSFFEMTVAMAFDHFRRQKVDLAIIETGLGGRLDSTNIITPLLSIITNIGYDHQAQLGNTLPEIASEKAGIIKKNVPVVIGESHPETARVFIDKAYEQQTSIVFADQVVDVMPLEQNWERVLYRIESAVYPVLNFPQLALDLVGSYQRNNLRTALLSAHLMELLGFPLTYEIVHKALSQVTTLAGLIGRWQLLGTQPLTIADSGHNREGWQYTVAALQNYEVQQWHIVLGTVQDKDIRFLWSLLPKTAHYYCCKAAIPRGLAAEVLQQQAQEHGFQATAYPSVCAAYAAAQNQAQTTDGIFIGGSIFVVAEVV